MAHNTSASNTIVLPDLDIDALVDASPADFLEEILVKNPGLPAVQVTRHNLCCCFLRMAAKLSQTSPFSAGVTARINAVKQRWLSSAANDVNLSRTVSVLLPGIQRGSTLATSTAPNRTTSDEVGNTELPKNVPILSKSVGSGQSLTRVRSHSKPSRTQRLSPYNRNVIVQTAQFLEPSYRRKLIQNGNCLIVSLPSETGHTLPTKTTHAHLVHRTDQAGSSHQIRLVMASYPSIVLVYENKPHKDMAARQIEALKFQFGDDDPVKLEVQDSSDNAASARATYTLGQSSLYFCNYQESLQRFFCNEGLVPVTNIIRTGKTGVSRTELLVRYRFCPAFMEKLTARPGGHRDTRIPAEPAESCSVCQLNTGQGRQQSIPKVAHRPPVRPSPLTNGNGSANAEIPAHPFLQLPGPDFAARHTSLDELKITSYIEAFKLLNGVDATTNIQPSTFVRGFNQFLNSFYPDSEFEARLAVLHRIDGGERVADWELLCQILRSHFTVEYMSDSGTASSKRKCLNGNRKVTPKRPKRMVAADFF